MYFWSIKKLTTDLKDNKISEKEKFKYFLTLVILELILINLIVYTWQEINTANLINSLITFVGFILAVTIIYKKNKKGDNKNYIERYVCLSLPAAVRAFVYSLIAAFIFGIIGTIVWGEQYTNTMASSDIFSNVMAFVFFVVLIHYWIYKSVAIISKK